MQHIFSRPWIAVSAIHFFVLIRKVNMNKLRAEYTLLMRKRKDNDQQEEERRLAIEKQLQDEQEASLA
jgi:hypothetical protein